MKRITVAFRILAWSGIFIINFVFPATPIRFLTSILWFTIFALPLFLLPDTENSDTILGCIIFAALLISIIKPYFALDCFLTFVGSMPIVVPLGCFLQHKFAKQPVKINVEDISRRKK